MSMHCLSTNGSHHNAFRQVRARRALTLFNNVLLRTRRALALYKVYGKLAVGPFWFLTEPHWTALVPFWFSTEHHWTVLVPFWLSADDFTTKWNFSSAKQMTTFDVKNNLYFLIEALSFTHTQQFYSEFCGQYTSFFETHYVRFRDLSSLTKCL